MRKDLYSCNLVIMCGLPRCGKSRYLKENSGDLVVICPDQVRSMIFGHQYHKNAEDFVWAFVKGMAKIILSQGKNVAIDATHITYRSRDSWVKLAREYNAKTVIIWVKTTLKECLKRNDKSPDGERLPEGVIVEKATRFEDPYYEDSDIEVVEYLGQRAMIREKVDHWNFYVRTGDIDQNQDLTSQSLGQFLDRAKYWMHREGKKLQGDLTS